MYVKKLLIKKTITDYLRFIKDYFVYLGFPSNTSSEVWFGMVPV